jgi:hypothetical protein
MLDNDIVKSKPVGPELKHFQKLVGLMRKTPTWNDDPDKTKIMDDLCVNTSKEAQDMRDIMWRMVEAEMKHPYRAGCKHCEAKKSAKTTQA